MITGFDIKRANEKDKEMIAAAWRKGYSHSFNYIYPKRWDWLFYKNPFIKKNDRELPVWLAIQDKEVVAWTCAMEVPFGVNGKTWPGAWGNLAYTLKDYRRQGLGKALKKGYLEAYPVFAGLGFSKANRRNEYRLGSINGNPLFIYLKLINDFDADTLYASAVSIALKYIGKDFEKLFASIGNTQLKSMLNQCMSILFRKYRGRRLSLPVEDFKIDCIEEINHFDKTVDHFWEKIHSKFSFAVLRGSAYLNWKYVIQPYVQYKKYLFKNGGGDIKGILIYRMSKYPELPVGVISEILFDDENMQLASTILRFAEKKLIEAGAKMILCGASSQLLQSSLTNQYFKLIDLNIPLIILSKEAKNKIDLNETLKGDWLLSLGDSDLDQFRLGNQPEFSTLIRSILNRIETPVSRKLSSSEQNQHYFKSKIGAGKEFDSC